MPRSVQVDAIAPVEVRLRRSRHDCREIEDHVGPARHEVACSRAGGQVGDDRPRMKGSAFGRPGRDDVRERQLLDRGVRERPVLHQPLRELPAEHPGRAEDQDPQRSDGTEADGERP